MEMKLSQVAELVQGELAGDGGLVVKGPAPIDSCGPENISYIADLAKKKFPADCKAGCVFLPLTAKGQNFGFGGNIIYVQNPQYAFTLVLRQLAIERRPKIPWGIHEKACVHPAIRFGKHAAVGAFSVVEEGAEIGDFSVIYPNCYIGANTKIGSNCLIYPNVTIRENCVIGDRVIIHPGAVIGADGFGYVCVNGKHEKIPQLGKVVIENDVEIGALSAVDRAMLQETRVGAGTKIDNLVQIAHNVQIGRACIIVAQAGIAGSSRLGDGVVIGGQAGIADHVKLGDKAMVAAQSGIMGDLPDGAVMFGSPAKPHGEAFRTLALLGKLPEMYKTLRELKKKFLPENGKADEP